MSTDWDGIGGGGTTTPVVDNLTSTSTTDALSANQGRELKVLVDGIITGIRIIDNWNATTNTPDISIVTQSGDAYIVNIAGSTDIGGITDWKINDIALKTDSGWLKIDNTEDVTILKDADIGVNVQAYDVDIVSDSNYIHTDNNYTTTEKTKLSNIEENAKDDQNASEIPTTNIIGTPTIANDVKQQLDYVNTSGIIEGCDLTDNGDGTISTSDGHAFLRPTSGDDLSPLILVQGTGTTNITLIDGETNYVYLDYNGGSPICKSTTIQSDIDCQSKCLAYIIYRNGTKLHVIDDRQHGLDASRKSRKVMRSLSRFIHQGDGSILGEVGNLGLSLTSGSFFYTVTEIPHPAFDTSIVGTANENTFVLHYRDGLGGFIDVEGVKVIDSTVYDNGSGIPTSISNNKYGVSWVYILNDTPSELHVVMGQDEYGSQSEAENASLPSTLPNILVGLGALVGFVVYQEGSINFDNILSALGRTFSSSSPTEHDGLSGLNVGDYQHLTVDEKTYITSNIEDLLQINLDTNEPTGFIREQKQTLGVIEFSPDGTKIISKKGDETISIRTDGLFYDGSIATAREFAISPLSVVDGGDDTFSIYIEGIKYIKTSTEKITLLDTSGLKFVYFDRVTKTLSVGSTFSFDYFEDSPIVSTFYWNTNTQKLVNFGDERHGITMDGFTHRYLHFTQGTKYISGMEIQGMSNGSPTFTQVTSGLAYDEDVDMYPLQQSTLPFLHRAGTSWTVETDNNSIAYLVGGVTQFNCDTNYVNYGVSGVDYIPSNSYELRDVTGNDRMIMFFILTNNIEFPYVKILGQKTYASSTTARADVEKAIEELKLDGLPTPEFMPIGAVIVDSSGNLDDITSDEIFVDLRKYIAGGVGSISGVASIHNDTTGRDSADAHPISAITNLQTELDSKANIVGGNNFTGANKVIPVATNTMALDFAINTNFRVDTLTATTITALNVTGANGLSGRIEIGSMATPADTITGWSTEYNTGGLGTLSSTGFTVIAYVVRDGMIYLYQVGV